MVLCPHWSSFAARCDHIRCWIDGIHWLFSRYGWFLFLHHIVAGRLSLDENPLFLWKVFTSLWANMLWIWSLRNHLILILHIYALSEYAPCVKIKSLLPSLFSRGLAPIKRIHVRRKRRMSKKPSIGQYWTSAGLFIIDELNEEYIGSASGISCFKRTGRRSRRLLGNGMHGFHFTVSYS